MNVSQNMIIKGVLFDFDGTLTLPGTLDFPAIKREMGCPENQAILEYLETLPSDEQARLMKILEEKEMVAAEASRPNNGAEKCISTLKQRGALLGILTRNSLRSVKQTLKKFESVTVKDFAAIITRDCSLPKPHPQGVYKAAEQMGLLPSQLMVVGDFRFDVIAGKAAGACTVLLTNEGRTAMEPGDPEPDHTISDLERLLDILGTFSGKDI
jgi:HAD superfamily hydrolase (TIGR01509 family)